MNLENLHELIQRYENSIDWIYGTEHDELFKWRAMATWRKEWLKPKDAFTSFADRFTAAKKDFSLFMDNSRMHPSSGVIKLWEKEPETVEHLFSEVLFAETNGDIATIQDHMDTFLDDYEGLRQNTFRGIGHTRFIPTKEQREVEEARKELVAALYQEWQKRMRENRVIIDYLERAPRKHSPKNALISDLSGSDEQNKKTIQNAYRRLLKAGILGEKNNDNGTIETRIIVRRSNAATKLPTLPPSTYQVDIYANICRNDIYKVDYTVGPPEEIDRINNTRCFTSKSSGKKYATSLERCSCPAFCKGCL